MGQEHSNSTWDTAVDERRKSTRFAKEPGTDGALVWDEPGREMLVDVYDESLDGICLIMRDVARYEVGVTATIIYHSDFLGGTVRRVTPQLDGTFLVGFECKHWARAID